MDTSGGILTNDPNVRTFGAMSTLSRFLPILSWGRAYRRTDLRSDLGAGLTIAAMLVPQAMAYALLAGLPPEVGLYAATVPVLVYAVFGTSRQLAVGPVAIVSLLTASALAPIAEEGTADYLAAAALLALMVGVVHLVLGFGRLGLPRQLLVPCGAGRLHRRRSVDHRIQSAQASLRRQHRAQRALPRHHRSTLHPHWATRTAPRSPSASPRSSCCSPSNGLRRSFPQRWSSWSARSWPFRCSTSSRAASRPSARSPTPCRALRCHRSTVRCSAISPPQRSSSPWSASWRASRSPRSTPAGTATTSIPTRSSSVWAPPTWPRASSAAIR